jgi:crotonobetainyl-CoA:carnitine CoA-transferase CaiB-like acyl-CoA transferase
VAGPPFHGRVFDFSCVLADPWASQVLAGLGAAVAVLAAFAHRGALIPMIGETMASRCAGEWRALLEPAGICCGSINRLDQVFRYSGESTAA